MSLATVAPSSSSTSASTTFAPSAANSRASASPCPRAAPLISATFPVSRPILRTLCRDEVHAPGVDVDALDLHLDRVAGLGGRRQLRGSDDDRVDDRHRR